MYLGVTCIYLPRWSGGQYMILRNHSSCGSIARHIVYGANSSVVMQIFKRAMTASLCIIFPSTSPFLHYLLVSSLEIN